MVVKSKKAKKTNMKKFSKSKLTSIIKKYAIKDFKLLGLDKQSIDYLIKTKTSFEIYDILDQIHTDLELGIDPEGILIILDDMIKHEKKKK